jgi:predicted nucleic acid-binding protein
MKRILFDTNVVLDVLLDRQPNVEASAAVWGAVETGGTKGMLAAHAVTTIHFLVRKELGTLKARQIVWALLRVFGVAAVNGAVVQEALQLPFSDFEDAVTAAAARLAGCECIVTRDPKGFRASPVRALTPEAVQPLLGQGTEPRR